jgi:hypothetical protein
MKSVPGRGTENTETHHLIISEEQQARSCGWNSMSRNKGNGKQVREAKQQTEAQDLGGLRDHSMNFLLY